MPQPEQSSQAEVGLVRSFLTMAYMEYAITVMRIM